MHHVKNGYILHCLLLLQQVVCVKTTTGNSGFMTLRNLTRCITRPVGWVGKGHRPEE